MVAKTYRDHGREKHTVTIVARMACGVATKTYWTQIARKYENAAHNASPPLSLRRPNASFGDIQCPNICRFGHRLWCKRVPNNGPHIECPIRFEPNINKKHRSPTNQTESTITAVSSALRVLNQFVPPIRRFRFDSISIPSRFGSMSIFVLTFGCSDFVRNLRSVTLQ